MNSMERRWRRGWMKLAHTRYISVLARKVAAWGMPPLAGRVQLAALHPKGYLAASVRLYHSEYVSGSRCFLGDNVLIYKEPEGGSVEIGDRVHIHENTSIQTGNGGSVYIGDGTHIQPRCQFSAYVGRIEIGKDVEIAPNCGFYPYNHKMDPAESIREQPLYSRQGIVIEDEAWLGYGVVVLDGVRIGKGAVVAAGAVVTSDVAENSIVAGVPAREVSTRAKHTALNQSG